MTIALSVPIQPNAAQDVFKFRLLASAATNTLTTITQSLEEQDAAGKAAVEARAAALPGAALRTLLGSTITPASVANNSSAVCQVRTAGPRSAPTATLLDRQGTFRVSASAPTGPIILGGINLQPSATFTVDGVVYATAASWTSLTPSILSVNNKSSLVDPVGTFPLQRQTGTLQGSACGQTATVPVPVSPFTSLAASYHTLVVQPDGTVAGWARNDYGQLNIPAGLTGVVAVAAGQAHSVALKSDGTVVTWGDNLLGELNVPAGLNSVVGISVGALHTLAVKSDGTVAAWGFSNQGETTVPAGLSGVVAVSAGNHDSLALKSDGTVVGWGYNSGGRTNIPAGLTGVIAISAGNYSMALKSDGTVVVWGIMVEVSHRLG
ncbi:hypothetical protein MF271_20965 (plasmid) [Deinococcus sp. KNUC1210]|uniref:RCC1 domain-containing protein n=1 Tax=Deinococcus sp. KNUC1210 TaxID=2917691 RepID=UPI001EF11D09|nr:hypothetical protein [Deinococcus sp. KNUC1210]ULH17526.1 hypothetical protein MF271_20965 [Deinococcus sp. KNUC1210]